MWSLRTLSSVSPSLLLHALRIIHYYIIFSMACSRVVAMFVHECATREGTGAAPPVPVLYGLATGGQIMTVGGPDNVGPVVAWRQSTQAPPARPVSKMTK